MELVSFWAAASLRSIGLAAASWIGLQAARVQSPAARHAVWTLMTAGMLAIVLASATLPSLPVRVLRPRVPAATVMIASLESRVPAPILSPAPRPFPWTVVYAAGLLLFGGRLLYGYAATCRLVRGSRRVPAFDSVYASEGVAVPLTVGWLRPKILLPPDWETWEPEKLHAVLVHERTHAARADWAIAVLAGVNRCVFWFHPLAWWLNAHLRVLAEQACDDASLPQVASRESYAQVLVEMAAAVRTGKGRVNWEATAMAGVADVRMRVERILDESRPVWPAMSRRRWVTLALCAVPVVYVAAVARPARVLAQDPRPVSTVVWQSLPKPKPTGEQTQAAATPLSPPIELPPAPLAAATAGLAQRHEDLVIMLARLQSLAALKRYEDDDRWKSADREQLTLLEAQIAFNESQLAQAREVYTDGSPLVRHLQTILTELRKQRDELAKTAAQSPQLEQEITALKAEIESLSAALDEKRLELQELTKTSAPRLILRTEPEYTPDARNAHIEGKVELAITVDPDGRVTEIQVTRELGSGLDQKAIECVKNWRFQPALRNGQPVTAFASVEVVFRLQ